MGLTRADKAQAREIATQAGAAMPRLPMPQACLDPGFLTCLEESLATPELLAQFDRLYGASLSSTRSPIALMVDKATGKLDDDVKAFAGFVHECIYLRISDEALGALRLTRMARPADGTVA